MNQQRGVVLIIGMMLMALVTVLSLGCFEQAMLLQKLRHHIQLQTSLQVDTVTFVNALENAKGIDNCIQQTRNASWFDDWQLVQWQQRNHCSAQVGETLLDYLVEQMSVDCWYYFWRVDDLPDTIKQWPIQIYRITIVAHRRHLQQPLLTEIYLAKPANSDTHCESFHHELILGRHAMRQRSTQKLS